MQQSPRFPLHSSDCEDRVVSFVVGAYKRSSNSNMASTSAQAASAMEEQSNQAFETDQEATREQHQDSHLTPVDASAAAASATITPPEQQQQQQQIWRTAVPNQHVDEQTKRNYVLEVSRRLNLTRREMALAANIQDFRNMNYWIRDKEGHKAEVKRAGAILYNWAVSTDSRVAVPMSIEEEEILRSYQHEKMLARQEMERERQIRLARSQQARAKLQKEKHALESKKRREAAAAAAAAAASAAAATAAAQMQALQSAGATPPVSAAASSAGLTSLVAAANKKRTKLVSTQSASRPATDAAKARTASNNNAAAPAAAAVLPLPPPTSAVPASAAVPATTAAAAAAGSFEEEWGRSPITTRPYLPANTAPTSSSFSLPNTRVPVVPSWDSPRPASTTSAAAGANNGTPLRPHSLLPPAVRRDYSSMFGSSPMISRSSFEETPTRMNSNSSSSFTGESPISLETPRQQQRRSAFVPLDQPLSVTRLGAGAAASLMGTPMRVNLLDADSGTTPGGGGGEEVSAESVHLLRQISDAFQGHDLPDATPTSTPMVNAQQQRQQSSSTDAALPRSSARKLEF